jgi:hypothetical protein
VQAAHLRHYQHIAAQWQQASRDKEMVIYRAILLLYLSRQE